MPELKKYQMFIDGQWVDSDTKKTFKTLNPDGDFGFTLDGSGTLKKKKNKKDDEEEDKDPLKLRTFL